MPEDARAVNLPADLCAAAEQKFGARFGTIEEFLGYVLRELLRDDATQMNQDEQRIVEERLKDLGYM
jgi:hypothetical protein